MTQTLRKGLSPTGALPRVTWGFVLVAAAIYMAKLVTLTQKQDSVLKNTPDTTTEQVPAPQSPSWPVTETQGEVLKAVTPTSHGWVGNQILSISLVFLLKKKTKIN